MNFRKPIEVLMVSVPPAEIKESSVPSKKKSQLLTFGTIPIASILAGFVVAAIFSIFVLQGDINSTLKEKLIAQAADNLQIRIDQNQTQLIRQTNSMATSIRLTELVENGDFASRSLEEARLREMIPNAIRVRLFKVGDAKVERDALPPFSYTSLDMVNRVEQGEYVFLEAIFADGRWVVSLASPIKNPSDTIIHGTLFVYLDITAFSDQLSELDGKVKLIQSFANTEPVEFLNAGSGDETIVIKRNLKNANWSIEFNPSASLVNASVGNLVNFLLPIFIASLLAALGSIFGLRQLITSIGSDTHQLHTQMSDAINGNFRASTTYQLTEFADLDIIVSRMGKKEVEEKIVDQLDVVAIPKQESNSELVDIDIMDETGQLEDEDMVEVEDEILDEEVDISSIFRAYDIRGVVDETLTEEVVYRIGLAIGTQAGELGEQSLVVGADGRLSSPELADALISGLTQSGRDVINIGFVPTPLVYYATHNTEARSGVMITGSHNAPEFNGLKIVLDGRTLVDEDIQALYQLYISGEFSEGNGDVTEIDIRDDYIDAVSDDVVVAQPLKVVFDCGNGIAGEIAPDLIAALGCEVLPLYCEVDGNFPNHHPDPINPDNLTDLIATVQAQGADIGLAVDGDGDRIVAVTKTGEIIWPDRLLMLFAKDIVSRNPGSDVVYDVKCTRHLNNVISGFGGRPIISRSGHSFIKARMTETDAMLGGEMSGHICFKERWFGFDDGLYAAARLLEIVGSQTAGLAELLQEFPTSLSTPEIQIPVDESVKFDFIERLQKETSGFEAATITTIDGLRVDFSDSWGLVRASNTSPCLTLRFEADDEDSLENIQALFREKLFIVDESLQF
jgi:phosphomannomutase/phosphoglucomutase